MSSKKAISVGIIGAAGTIGEMHAQSIAAEIDGANLVAIYDLNLPKIKKLADKYDAKIMESAESSIDSPLVDAVIVASWDETHAELTNKCIAKHKPVFCEKPLATNAADCKDLLKAEQSAGENLVQLGFMRRFDPCYKKIKDILKSGKLGIPLMAHCISRTPRIASSHTTPMHITNIVIHEIDIFRWLLEEDVNTVQALFPRKTSLASAQLQDPQFVIMQSKSGVLIDVEVSANSYYGYEIQCEVVCEKGTIRLPDQAEVMVRSRLMCSHEIPDSWSNRFPVAYRSELQHWIDYIRGRQKQPGPGCSDGYAACVISDALIRSQASGVWEKVIYEDVLLDG
ncbi:MAG: Gfo/Idh/MocA family oxidoreductase [Lachnospiraceae bacterium]